MSEKVWRVNAMRLYQDLEPFDMPVGVRSGQLAILPAADYDALQARVVELDEAYKRIFTLEAELAAKTAECAKALDSIRECRVFLRGCMNHAFNETPIIQVAKDVSAEFHRNRYQLQTMQAKRDTALADLATARAALPLSIAALRERTWKPITEMSRDDMETGMNFILWSPKTHASPHEGRYWTQENEWCDTDGYVMKPTHFMPLPTPPQEEPAHE